MELEGIVNRIFTIQATFIVTTINGYLHVDNHNCNFD